MARGYDQIKKEKGGWFDHNSSHDHSLLILPLKCLQKSQLDAFSLYGIPTVVLNEDMPDDSDIWSICVLLI
jgi:hypothetical protein